MSKVVISMVAMFILMIFPGAGLWGLLSNVLGGGVAESFLYPIYGGLILLAGLIVGCTVLILEEMRSLKDKIDHIYKSCYLPTLMVIIGIGAHRQSGDEYYSMYSPKSVVEAML